MKNKVLIILFLSLFGLPFMAQAQWEKCMEQKNVVMGLNRNYIHLTHYKNTSLLLVPLHDETALYYANDKGVNWNRLKTAPTRKPNSRIYQVVINESGIFCLETESFYNPRYDQYYLCQTKDLGVTWKIDTLPSVSRYQLMSDDKNVSYISYNVNTNNQYKINYLNKYNTTEEKWKLQYSFVEAGEHNTSVNHQMLSLSKNRMVYSTQDSIHVREATTKALLAKFPKKGAVGDVSAEVEFYAEDSTMVYYYKKNGKMFIDVSTNLGRVWRSKEVNSPCYAEQIGGNRVHVQIKNNKIYVIGDEQILVSDDFGGTWQPILNTNIVVFRPRLVFADSLMLIPLEYGRILSKKINDTAWTYPNYILSDFTTLIKVKDSLLWAVSEVNQRLFSRNYGKTWQLAPLPDSLNYANLLAKNGTVYTSDGLMSADTGRTWNTSPVPAYRQYQVVGDTIFLLTDASEIVYSARPPYQVWSRPLPTSATIFYYYNGVIYFIQEGRLYGQGIKRMKLDGTMLEPILWQETTTAKTLIVDNNKIYFSIVNGYHKVCFTNDNGLTWQASSLPTNLTHSLFRTDNMLLASSELLKHCGKLNPMTGGVYLSADDGNSWFLFSEGIQLNCTPFIANFYRIDSFVYAKSNYGLWRTNITNLRLKAVSGIVFEDKNRNGVKNINENGLPNVSVYLAKTGAFTTTDSLGNYTFVVDLKETDTVRAIVAYPYAAYTPPYSLVTPTDAVKNLGVYLPANVKELSINATALIPPRPGFGNWYALTYKNNGTVDQSGKITFQYTPQQTFNTADSAPNSNINHILSWNFQNLKVGETRNIRFTLHTAANVPIRSLITNVATIEPIVEDTLKSNNVDSLIQTVVASYDPNDKQVSFQNNKTPPSVFDPNSELIYTIRFQNTGNYQADLVRVVDTLSDKLDIATVRVLASSHNYTLTVKNKNVLVFDFNPIYLPDSTTSEAQSHGFIKFAIKPKKVLSANEVIKNTAYIYFDYNPAIITNTVESANQPTNGLRDPSVSDAILVFPNPSNGAISFQSDRFKEKNLDISIYSIEGKLMYSTAQTADNVHTINTETLRKGVYFLHVKTENESFVGKFIVLQ
jgi:uncharacterized repeat protein (TIGR01451 family)